MRSSGIPQYPSREAAGPLLRTIPTGDMAAMWAQFANGGFIEFPFTGVRISDFATFEATVGPLFAQLPDLMFTVGLVVRLAVESDRRTEYFDTAVLNEAFAP